MLAESSEPHRLGELHDWDVTRRCARRAPLPTRLSLGRLDLGVSNRGGGPRGRPRPLDLGHLQPHAGQGAPRRHRRHRQRLVSPHGGGSGAAERARRRRLPVLGGVVSGPAHWTRTVQSARTRLLPGVGRRAAWPGHRSSSHCVPLGPAAGARGRGRLGQPRDGVSVRRVRGGARPRPRRRGRHVDHAQRAPAGGPPGLPRGNARPRQDRLAARGGGDASPPARPWVGGRRDPLRAVRPHPGRHHDRSTPGPRRGRGRGTRRRGPRRGAEPHLPRAGAARLIPRCRPRRAPPAGRADRTRRHGSDIGAARLSRAQLLLPVLRAHGRLERPAPRRKPARGVPGSRQLRAAGHSAHQHGLADRARGPL